MVLNRWICMLLALLSLEVHAALVQGPEPKQPGDLAVVIVASDSPDYVKNWVATKPSAPITIKRLKVAKPDQLIVAAFLVTGFSANSEHQYSFRVSWYLLKPDGKPLGGERNYATGKGLAPPNATFVMANPALDIVLEASDPEGTYTLVAQAEDMVSGKKADSSYEIKFIK